MSLGRESSLASFEPRVASPEPRVDTPRPYAGKIPSVTNPRRAFGRRDVLSAAAGLIVAPLLAGRLESAALPTLKITGFELIPVRATSRTVWLFVRLRTDAGLAGLGEASDAFRSEERRVGTERR